MNKRAAVEKIKGANESELIKSYLATKKTEHFAKIMALYDKKLFNYIVRRIGDAGKREGCLSDGVAEDRVEPGELQRRE
jgi:hypothetical protein